jgi:hypothetical protein
MISSQDGTEERLPRAAFRPGRPAGSSAAWACASTSSGSVGDSAAVSAGRASAGRFSRVVSAALREADEASRPAARGHEFRSAAGERESSFPGSAGTGGADTGGTDTEGATGAGEDGTGADGAVPDDAVPDDAVPDGPDAEGPVPEPADRSILTRLPWPCPATAP